MGSAEFTAIQAARLSGCSVSQVRYWDRVGLVPATRTGERRGRLGYGFRDLVALRMVRALLDAGLSLQRVRRAVEYLREVGDDVGALKLVSDGTTVFACHDDGEVLDALKQGQLAFFVAVDAVADDVRAEVREYDRDRDAFVDALQAPSAEERA